MALYPSTDTFVRGEVSPRLHARAPLDLYRAGLSQCMNFLTLPHGGLRRRGGTMFVGEVKDSSKRVRLIPFVFSSEQAYALEMGDFYFRVYAYGVRVGTVEVATPWPEAVLGELQFIQSADVMWVVHDDYLPCTITRNSHTSWSLDVVPFSDGPFAALNGDDTKTMQASAISGSVTITANFSAFTSADVGRLVRIDMESYGNIPPWSAGGKLATAGENVLGKLVRYEGNVYESLTNDSSGAGAGGWRFGGTPPTHTRGAESDGVVGAEDLPSESRSGVLWEYLHSGYGVAVITAYTSATQVTAAVLSRFPDEVVSAPSHLWRMGAFGGGAYANSVALFEERLAMSRRFSVYASKTGDFSSFRLGAADDDGLEFLQAGGGQANDIVWIADAEGFLLVATTGGIRALSGSGMDEALTPSSFKNRRSRTSGAAKIRPVDAGQSFIYVTRGRKGIAELTQNQMGRFFSDDVGQISEHIPKRGVVEIAFQNEPDPVLWFPLETGEVGTYTHQPSQEVRGMHRQQIAGSTETTDWAAVESCVVTPGQVGSDDVWMIVRRTIGGATRRYIEMKLTPFEYGDISECCEVDSALSYSGTAVTSVSGMVHLAGQTVDALCGNRVYRGLTVSPSGVVTLPAGAAAATTWVVGLPYESAADTLELDVGGKDGSLLGRRKKVSKLIMSLLETDLSGLSVSSMMRDRWERVKLPTIAVSDGTVSLYTGNVDVPIDDSWAGQGRVRIRFSGPTPCTIRAITPVFDAEP